MAETETSSSFGALWREDGPVRRRVRQALAPFWVVPALWCVAAVALGVALPHTETDGAGWLPLLFPGDAEGARSFLSSIAGAMISVTGLVFSITIVVLQLASSQFSPRVLRTFLDDGVPQHTLGVFAASFLYALTVLRVVSGGGPQTSDGSGVPQLSITLAFVLVLASVGMFLAFIHHITRAISVGAVVRQIGDETRALLRRDQSAQSAQSAQEAPEGGTAEHLGAQVVITATRHGTLDTVDRHALVAAATRADVRIEVVQPLGAFVPEGMPVALVHGDRAVLGERDWGRVVIPGLGVEHERSLQQDLTFGMRQLVDIGERALSPGVNDPTTAVQVLDELHDVLRRLGAHPDPPAVRQDADGVVRLVTREHTFAEALDLAVDELAHWGADSLQVPRRIASLLDDLAVAVLPAHRHTVEAKRGEVPTATVR